MRWQHTRCRIGRVTLTDRYEGVTDIGQADENVWGSWHYLTHLLHQNQVRSLCVFGTMHDGCTFNAISRSSEDISRLMGSAFFLVNRLATYSED